jgi:hypothetical protein
MFRDGQLRLLRQSGLTAQQFGCDFGHNFLT